PASTGAVTEACPACGAIYVKVEQIAAARAAPVPEDPKAAAKRAKKEADAAWEVQAEAIRQKARDDIEAQRVAREAAKAEAAAAVNLNPIPAHGFVCTQCGHVGDRKSAVRGTFVLELALWVTG